MEGQENIENKAIKTAWYSFVLNLGLSIVKGITGILGNSYALIADAIESFTDVLASLLVVFGLKYAKRPPDENHPYGHGRIEPLITFVVVGFLITSATLIAYQSIEHILTPHTPPESWTLVVLGVIILWKEFSYRMVIKRSKETNSSALKADAWHHRSDAITSVAAFIGISIALYWGEGFESADDWAALFASCFILFNAYQIFRPALGEMMDEHLHDDLMQSIREISSQVEGVMDTEKCFIRKAGMKYHVDLHATVNADISVREGHAISHLLKDTLKSKLPQLGHVLIHVEPDEG